MHLLMQTSEWIPRWDLFSYFVDWNRNWNGYSIRANLRCALIVCFSWRRKVFSACCPDCFWSVALWSLADWVWKQPQSGHKTLPSNNNNEINQSWANWAHKTNTNTSRKGSDNSTSGGGLQFTFWHWDREGKHLKKNTI